MALANHHDNFDNWDSKHQPWNSVRLGPKKDLIGGWEKATRRAGLRFGVSVHASRAWSWYEVAQGADKDRAVRRRAVRRQAHARAGEKVSGGMGSTRRISTSSGTRRASSSSGTGTRARAAASPTSAYCDKLHGAHDRPDRSLPARHGLLRRPSPAALSGERRRPEDRRALLQHEHAAARRQAGGGAHREGAERAAAEVHGVGHRARRGGQRRSRSPSRRTPASATGTTRVRCSRGTATSRRRWWRRCSSTS